MRRQRAPGIWESAALWTAKHKLVSFTIIVGTVWFATGIQFREQEIPLVYERMEHVTKPKDDKRYV